MKKMNKFVVGMVVVITAVSTIIHPDAAYEQITVETETMEEVYTETESENLVVEHNSAVSTEDGNVTEKAFQLIKSENGYLVVHISHSDVEVFGAVSSSLAFENDDNGDITCVIIEECLEGICYDYYYYPYHSSNRDDVVGDAYECINKGKKIKRMEDR